MESRKRFVEQVSKTILENHAKNEAAFIFGISGKWGEGKTKFLDDLELELNKDSSVRIIRVNPWKFASDRVSFLRNFLKAIYLKPKNIFSRVRNFLNSKDQFRELYHDVSQNSIHWGWGIVLVLYFILFLVYKKLLPETYQSIVNFVKAYKVFFTIILIPFGLAFIGKLITFQKSSKSISTIDEFDRILEEILSKETKKIIIFVDDLDRVTPSVARDVLDNLRTFFDKKEISFVVTGDHTVLERYLGKDLLPDSSEAEQLEEGKRFLKKIFNVYWRLPLPIEKELDEFLKELIAKNNTELKSIFQEKDIAILQKYLKLYFESNFRHIIRFLEIVLFTFRIIKQQVENADADQKPYFEELLKNPLLVIRILMIQELCAPLFEEILRNPQILSDLEYAVEKKDTSKIDQIMGNSDDYSPSQNKFIKTFLYEEPRFYKSYSLVVSDIKPFLYFAADASFGDSRGPSSADFISIVNTGDPKQIKDALISSGQTKITEACKAFIDMFNRSDNEGKKNILTSIMNTLQIIPTDHASHNIFVGEFKQLDYSFLSALNSQDRMTTLNLIWKWLDLLDSDLSDYIGKFLFTHQDDLNFVNLDNPGKFTSRIITHWLKIFYERNNQEALNKMELILPKLDAEVVKLQLTDLMEKLVENTISEGNHEYRNKRLNIINNFSSTHLLSLKKLIWVKITELNHDFWNWATQRPEIYNEKEFEQQIVAALNNVNSLDSLRNTFNFAKDKIKHLNTEFWDAVISRHFTLFIDNIGHFINENSYAGLAPNSDAALQIFDAIVNKISTTDDDNVNAQWITYLNKDKWIWKNITGKPNRRKFQKFAKSENATLKQNYESMNDQWTSNSVKI